MYRILKACNLIVSPVFALSRAKDKFQHPTTRINELWQTDYTYFKIVGLGWYYPSTVMDDYSRMILSWRLCSAMRAEDVHDARIEVRPRILSDNGPCYISKSLQEYLEEHDMGHTRGRPFHPMTQGKIERYHRSMKNIILLDNYYLPMQLEAEITRWVEYYNNERYHESLGNITPRNKYFGREERILARRRRIKKQTIRKRREVYRNKCIRAGNSIALLVS